MNTLIVANQVTDWPLHLASAMVVSAHAYLTEPCYRQAAQVINLCHPISYQSIGYYVSLLAQARGQQPLPEVKAIEDLHSDVLLHLLMEKLDRQMQAELADIDAPCLDLALYFGHNPAALAPALGQGIFELLPVPLLQVHFERLTGNQQRWQIVRMHIISPQNIPASHWPLIQRLAMAHAVQKGIPVPQMIRRKRSAHHPAVAILYDPDCQEPPSNTSAIGQFQQAARTLNMDTQVITQDDSQRLSEFDALFIRDTTSINHYTYQFSRRAAVGGLVVMDDPDSILQCTNKVYLNELFELHRLPTPKTLVVHRNNLDQVIPQLGLPCILKQPDGAFSLGVVKIHSAQQLTEIAGRFLESSDLILAQQYLPTTFDWRIGVLDRQPLFACKYFMARGHWQIIKRQQEVKLSEGQAAAVPLAQVPENVLHTALAAANLIGDGFYGVDLKQLGQQCCIIEVNDNPNVDMGNEDGILKAALYQQVMQVFCKRIAAPGRSLQ